MGCRDKDLTTQHNQPPLASFVVRPSVRGGMDAGAGGGGGGGRTGGIDYELGDVRREPPSYSHSDHYSDDPGCPPNKSWSIHTRPEIIAKYEIHERVGSGAYSDVYKARRLSDNLTVALKEVHDYQSAFREIEALQLLQNCPNVVVLYEYFCREDEDAVLVLEFLRTDMAAVIKEGKKNRKEGEAEGISVGEVKRWMMQILCGVDACHRNMIMHRDLKPGNLLISDDGTLKLADFGQARILMGPGFVVYGDDNSQPYEHNDPVYLEHAAPPANVVPSDGDNLSREGYGSQKQGILSFREMGEHKIRDSFDEMDKETTSIQDGDTSCFATGTGSDIGDDILRTSCSYEAGHDGQGALTSCVGTRWFKAPELLYGSTDYGLEIDLWSLGCIFAELLTLEPLFPGTSDIDQLSRIINVVGNLTEEVWPGCLKLPDFGTISFGKVENPIGLLACLPKRSPDEIALINKLICYDPASRATAMELLHDEYFSNEPLPVPVSDLRVPSGNNDHDEDSPGGWYDYKDAGSDSDFDEFGPLNVTTTSSGFSIQFS